MTTLFLDRRDAVIAHEAGTLAVRGADGTLWRAPLAPLERVVLRGPAQIATGAIAALHQAGCGLLVLSGRRGDPAGALMPRGHADAAIRLGQLALALDPAARAAIAQAVVRRKLLGQAALLRGALARRPDRRYPLTRGLAGLAEALGALRAGVPHDLARLAGIEGAGAAAYFAAFVTLFPPSAGFAGRNRRPPRDPVNAALSLAYTLGTFEAAREAWAAGLDPAIGFLHAPAPGRDSLACDLVEPLRPVLDRLVWRLFAEEVLRAAHFTRDGEACLLGKAGRMAFYAAWETAVGPARRALRRGLRPLVAAARARARLASAALGADPEEADDAAQPAS
jgi:CRISPR-associated protein Cas1